ncbi:TPA: Lymphocyte transmembrane adapter 1 [Trebouxia sp. C0006]
MGAGTLSPSFGSASEAGEAYDAKVDVTTVDNLHKLQLVDEKQSETFIQKGWRGGAGASSDAWLTSSAAQIGQVMLALPHAVSNTGMRAAIPLITIYTLASMWTIHLLTSLYVDLKARKVRAGTWEGGHEKRATQYFEVMHQLTGSRIVKYFVMVIVIISLLCTGIAQIIAIATGMYYLKDTISKRVWALVWGAILTCTMTLVPTFRHFRILNIISLAGTAYTAVYLIAQSGPAKMQNLFLGANVFMSGFGGHSMSFEVIDAMFQPSRYDSVYPYSYLYTYFVTVPHSFMTQLAYPTANAKYSNIYGAVPVDGWRNASIILMIIHQCVAYALYVTPVFFMWEKLVHTHDKPLWIRLPSRLPVALFVWLIALLFPFFDTINAIQGSIGYSFTAFVFPAGFYLWVYRSPQARANAPKQPRFIGGWTVALTLNLFLFIYFLVFGVGFGTWASIKNLVSQINTLGVFANCYQCSSIVASNKING